MNITRTDEQNITIISIDGRVDSGGAVELEKILQTVVAEGKYKIILDMAQVGYINSAGLRILADVLTANREKEGDLRLVGLNSKVRRVFEIIGFHKFFQEYDSIEAAKTDF